MGFLIALAIILLILFIKLGVTVRSQGETSLTLGVGIFKIPIFPKKDKEIKLSDYKIAKFRKKQAKLAAAEDKKKRKKRSDKKPSAKDNTAENAEDQEDQDTEKPKRDIMGLVETVTELVKVFLARFGRHLHIKVRRVVIIVGSEDAATTAVMYGAVCGAVQCLCELLYNCLNTRFTKNAEIRVEPDFCALKPQAEVDITFSVRVWQVFDLLIRTGIAYLKKIL